MDSRDSISSSAHNECSVSSTYTIEDKTSQTYLGQGIFFEHNRATRRLVEKHLRGSVESTPPLLSKTKSRTSASGLPHAAFKPNSRKVAKNAKKPSKLPSSSGVNQHTNLNSRASASIEGHNTHTSEAQRNHHNSSIYTSPSRQILANHSMLFLPR